MSDLPIQLPDDGAGRLRRAIDREGKILRALEALGPLADRDVVVVGAGEDELARYADAGARVRAVAADVMPWPLPDASADVVVSAWAGFRGIDDASLDEADRVLRPAGRVLIVHDYGRDDVSRLRGDQPEYGAWSRRDGPFLKAGFRVRVIHCFWTFDSIEEARSFLDVFGDSGRVVAEGLRRPRLSYNVAVYHRTKGSTSGDADATNGADAASPLTTASNIAS